MQVREITVHFEHPPIPIREYDWIAYFSDDDPDEDGQMMCGYGRTPLDAIRELLDREDEAIG